MQASELTRNRTGASERTPEERATRLALTVTRVSGRALSEQLARGGQRDQTLACVHDANAEELHARGDLRLNDDRPDASTRVVAVGILRDEQLGRLRRRRVLQLRGEQGAPGAHVGRRRDAARNEIRR